jgi:hypothetical protein
MWLCHSDRELYDRFNVLEINPNRFMYLNTNWFIWSKPNRTYIRDPV